MNIMLESLLAFGFYIVLFMACGILLWVLCLLDRDGDPPPRRKQ